MENEITETVPDNTGTVDEKPATEILAEIEISEKIEESIKDEIDERTRIERLEEKIWTMEQSLTELSARTETPPTEQETDSELDQTEGTPTIVHVEEVGPEKIQHPNRTFLARIMRQ